MGQLLSPIPAANVTSSNPKSSPDTVTLHPVVTTALASDTKLTTGADVRLPWSALPSKLKVCKFNSLRMSPCQLGARVMMAT